MAYEKNPDSLGALWKKTNDKGTFMTGTVEVNGEQIKIVVFPNGRKAQENQPDFRILRARPRADEADAAPAPKKAAPKPAPIKASDIGW